MNDSRLEKLEEERAKFKNVPFAVFWDDRPKKKKGGIMEEDEEGGGVEAL